MQRFSAIRGGFAKMDNRKILRLKDYKKKKISIVGEPEGDIVSLAMFQNTETVDFVCICCAHRWSDEIPLSMLSRPQWMGEIACPEIECASVGYVVRQ